MRFLKFNPANGESRIFCLDYIISIESSVPYSITIYPLNLEPYSFNIDFDEFVTKIYSDEYSGEYELIEIDEEVGNENLEGEINFDAI